ncbi:MAG: DUF1648 domain-containing protein [Chloroflexi bacterium]|nr:MAG: DUF1648 domain-containing protein [Chloroflexota bacterium]
MTFWPPSSRSGYAFLTLALLLLVTAGLLVSRLAGTADRTAAFYLSLGLLVVLAGLAGALYLALVAFSLQYRLTRNGLSIRWGWLEYRVPLARVTDVILPAELEHVDLLKRFNLLGLRLGRRKHPVYGPVRIFALAPPSDCALVVTPDGGYLLSPGDLPRFRRAWQARQNLPPTQVWAEGTVRRGPLKLRLLADPLMWGLVSAGLVVFLALSGYVALQYARLPAALPIHFNALGQADRIADKETLFTLLKILGGLLGGNFVLGSLVYYREKTAAYLLWTAGIIVGCLLWVAVVTIT